MRRKVTNFVLEIDVHAVTCPGVWLCPDGVVSVKLKLFDEVAETKHVEPVFPILLHEKFTFQKLFPDIYFLTELQEALDKEVMYVDLVQWPVSGSEIVLATFMSTLLDLLYPSSCRKTTEVDLLMDPSDAFPGILSPKIESSTKTTVEEIPLTDNELLDASTSVLLNSTKHDLERSVMSSIRDPIKRQRKVCHSRGQHEKKGADCSFTLSQSKHEKSRRHSPFAVRNLDTSVNTYESFLNSTRKPESRGRHENKGADSRFRPPQPKNEKSRRHSPFAIRNLDTSVNTYESSLNTTRKPERGRHGNKGAGFSFGLSQPKNEKSRRHSPFSATNLDTSVNTYESFLNTTRKPEREKDVLNSTQLVQWTSVSGSSSCADESPIRCSSTINKSRRNVVEAGSSSSGDKSSTEWNTTINNQRKSAKIEIDPKRSANDPEPHDTSSCLMCSQYNSFFEDNNYDE